MAEFLDEILRSPTVPLQLTIAAGYTVDAVMTDAGAWLLSSR
jgi:hypothetical protein